MTQRSALGRSHLQTLAQIRDEMARVYRACVTGKLSTKDGNSYQFQLISLAKVTESAVLEQRLEALESRASEFGR